MSLRCSPPTAVVCAAIILVAANRSSAQQPHPLSESRFYTGPTFSPDGSVLAVVLTVEAGSDAMLPRPESGARSVSKVELWDVATRKVSRTLGGQATGGNYSRPLTFSPDGKTLALAETHGRVRLWDTTTWQESTLTVPSSVPPRKSGRTTSHYPVAGENVFSPDSRLLVVCYTCAESPANCVVRVWDLSSGTVRAVFEVEGRPQHVTFLPESRVAVVVCNVGRYQKKHCELQIWSVDAAAPPARHKLSDAPLSGRFSPDGAVFAAFSPIQRDQIVLIDCQTGRAKPFAQMLQVYHDPHKQFAGGAGVSALAFSTDGLVLAAGGNADQKRSRLSIWNFSSAGWADSLAPIEHGPVFTVAGLEFSPGDKHLATVIYRHGTTGTTLYLWDLPDPSKTRTEKTPTP